MFGLMKAWVLLCVPQAKVRPGQHTRQIFLSSAGEFCPNHASDLATRLAQD